MKFGKEFKVGAIFLIAVVLLYIGLNFLKGQNLFSKENHFFVVYEQVNGLTPSSPIYANGYRVGRVDNVQYDYASPHRIVVDLRVQKELQIPQGTQAVLTSELLGGVNVKLKLGTSDVYYANGDTLTGDYAGGFTKQLSDKLMPQFTTLIPKIDTLVSALTQIAVNPDITATLSQADQLTRSLTKSAHDLEHLFHQELPKIVDSFRGTGEHLNKITGELSQTDYVASMQRVDSVIAQLKIFSESLNRDGNSLDKLLRDSALYDHINQICTNANLLINDVKKNPSRYINISVFGKKSKDR